ncbi:CPBP family intramembrane glutamic endopeptidase [Clostridium sp.]|uniref:CPBP family intramembrane glutamic endopeptidase n=1 Tax=Clostridium sp. TaxID=1506 RepID=UPI0025C02048|nr:CPBP family intramembrane glutamic endopeptidase [Clostridium sp.]
MKKKVFFTIIIYICIYILLYYLNSFRIKSLEESIIKNSIYYMISIMIVIFSILFYDKEIYKRLKIRGKSLKREFCIGIIIFGGLSIFTIIPFMITGNNEILSAKLPSIKMLIYFTLFNIFIVAPCEEFIFRGYFFEKFKLIFNNRLIANICSSILFGLLHYPNKGSLSLIIMPTIIGFIFIEFKEKIKNCSLLSLSIAHGLNNSLIDWISFIFT